MAKKKRRRRTPRKKARLRSRIDVAERDKTIVDQGEEKTVVGKDYTIFSRAKLNPEHKLFREYAKVRNLAFPPDAVIADLDFSIVAAQFKTTKKARPSFPSDEGYLRTYSGCKFPKGKFLILLPKSIWTPLREKIERYVVDVAREGYWADIYTVENPNAKAVKQFIASKSPTGALLVGNVSAAFYEHDGGTFPCDLYYMDTTGTWNDQGDDNTFKDHTGDVNPELWIARLFTPTLDGNDTALIAEYFDRNHKFRRGAMEQRRRALSFVDDDWSGYPKKIRKAWEGIPASFQDGIDAAIKWPLNNKVYFFKGDDYIRYDIDNGEMDAGYPKKISPAWKGFPAAFQSGVDAAVGWPGKNRIYFFKGNKYIRYDCDKQKVNAGYPKTIKAGWKDLPNDFHSQVDAAVLWPNGKIYIFKDDRYVRYDSAATAMDMGYPKQIAGAWNGFTEEFHAGVDAALMFHNEYSYYFSGNMYIKYNTSNYKVSRGFHDCGFDEMIPSGEIEVYTHPDETRAEIYKNEMLENHAWIQVCAHSGTTSHSFSADPSGGSVTSSYLRDTEPPRAYFYNLFACGPGRFTSSDYLAGWYLFNKTGGGQCEGLGVVASGKSGSMLAFEDFYAPMGQGKDLGTAYREWWIARGPQHDDGEIKWYYGLVLLGDPTLHWIKGCVPQSLSPNDGEVFNHYPRTITLQWTAVEIPGVRYDVEVDAKGALHAGKWAAETCQSWDVRTNLSGSSISYDFVGAQPGRWRVRARIGGVTSQWSRWQYFRFTV